MRTSAVVAGERPHPQRYAGTVPRSVPEGHADGGPPIAQLDRRRVPVVDDMGPPEVEPDTGTIPEVADDTAADVEHQEIPIDRVDSEQVVDGGSLRTETADEVRAKR